MNNILDKVIRSRCGGRVERCHTLPHHGSYSNAQHSWGVSLLMWFLYPDDFARLAIYCLSHDIGEGWTGDIPAPVFWAVKGLKEQIGGIEGKLVKAAGCPDENELAPEDFAKLKACDRLELYIWCKEQVAMGNMFVMDCLNALDIFFRNNPLPEPAQSLYLELSTASMIPRQQGIVQEILDGSGS